MRNRKPLNSSNFVYKQTLSNGLKVLVHEMPWAQSVTSRLLISNGPLYENKTLQGISHYLEHVIVSGSKKYPSRKDLDLAIQRYGGVQRAFTDKEYVVYQTKIPFQYYDFSLEFLREMVFNPLISDETIKREKGTIISELKKKLDSPDNYKWNLLDNFVWKNHPVAYETLGTLNTIDSITKAEISRWFKKFYIPNNCILVISGNVTLEEALNSVKNNFGNLKSKINKYNTKSEPTFIKSKPRVFIKNKKLKETHIMLAFSLGNKGRSSPDYYKILLLTSMISKVIFYKFVYNMGISYMAYARTRFVKNTGYIYINAGVHPNKLGLSINTITKTLKGLRITKKSISEAKEYLKGVLTLDIADTNDYASLIATTEFYTNNPLSPQQIREKIELISFKEINEIKDEIITNDNSALVLLGSVGKGREEEFDKKLKF